MSVAPIRGEFPDNSDHKPSARPAEREKLEPIANGKLREPSVAKKAKTAMFAEDAKSVGSYILWDVTLPAIKQTISDIVTNGVERMLFGDAAPRRRSAGSSIGSRISYSSIARRGELDAPGQPVRTISRRGRSTFDFGEILLPDRTEGLEIIERMRDVIDRFGLATVADLYDLAGISSSYTDNDWGWDNLADANVQRVRDGYVLVLPQPSPVKK